MTGPRPTSEPSASAGGSLRLSRSEPALIGLAHGSRHPEVVPTIEAVMAAAATPDGLTARAAFLDLSEPDLGTVAAELVDAGHQTAVVVPLLFTAAFHAEVDVPAAIADAAAASGLELRTADILGTGTEIELVLQAVLDEGTVPPEDAVLLYAVGSSRPSANAAVADLAARLATRRAGQVEAGFATCEPRATTVLDRLAGSGRALAVLPLFLAPGLLLDPVAARAAREGWFLAPPLGVAAAPVVRRRYRDAAARPALLG